jgi:hypothetical protein
MEMFSALLESVQTTAEHYQTVCELLTAEPPSREEEDNDIELGEIAVPNESSSLKLILSAGLYG